MVTLLAVASLCAGDDVVACRSASGELSSPTTRWSALLSAYVEPPDRHALLDNCTDAYIQGRQKAHRSAKR